MIFPKIYRYFILIFILGVIAFLSFQWSTAAFYKNSDSIPIYGNMPDFTLTERSGREITKSDLAGHVWVADFIFTRCAGQCPIMSSGMVKLAKEFPKTKFLSFTSDPAYDSPQVLSTYAGWYEADPKQWLFLTGEKNELNRVAMGLKFSTIDSPEIHSGSYVLIDRQGNIRGYYDSNDSERTKQLRQDIRLLTRSG